MKLVERSAKAKEGVPVYVSVMASARSSTEYVYVRLPTLGTDFCPACLRRVSGRGRHGRKGGNAFITVCCQPACISPPRCYRSGILSGRASLAFLLNVHEISSHGRRLIPLKQSCCQLLYAAWHISVVWLFCPQK